MKRTLISVLVAGLFCSLAAAQEPAGGFKLEGSVGLGYRATHDNARDAAKLYEYRDLQSGVIGTFDLKGRSPDYYVDAFGENIGYDDMFLELKGGRYGVFKYQIYENDIVHNWAFGARTPYSGIGGATLTATLPNLNPATWNSYDLRDKRKNTGGMFEFWNGTPWFIRVEANEVRDDGLKLIAGAQGTSPGNGFVDKPFPLDFKTRNLSLETGYASKERQFTIGLLHSRFTNENPLLRWSNGFFGNLLDTSYLPPDSDYTKLSLNGALKRLPYGSTLAGRLTYGRTTNSVPVATTQLSTGPAFAATNPSITNFDGKVVHKTASVSLHSNPTRQLDSRIYWNWFKKDNDSPTVTFSPAAGSGLTCGTALTCTTETLSYKKNNLGLDVGYRLDPRNRVVAGLDYSNLKRNRIDFDETKDTKASLEWRNTTFDYLGTRVKYQHLERRSHFLEANAGTSANDPEFLNRFIARFDASNVSQDLFKIGADLQPAELLDLGAEVIFKRNKYKDTVLGRTKDDRRELYLSAAYGDIRSLRVMAFADLELVEYNSFHRNISTVAADGSCAPAFPDCFDPNTVPNPSNYNWGAKERDRSWAMGLGADWLPLSRLKFSGSLVWQWTHGSADFAVQNTPATPVVPITNYDNTRKFSLNTKATYSVNRNVDLTAGFAYEKWRLDDISYNGYTYTIGAGASASYLSGANAFTNYTAHVAYLLATYHLR